MKNLIWSAMAFAVVGLSGCATSSTSSAPAAQPQYELTLKLNLDGVDSHGIAMASAARDHTIKITSRYDINYFIAQTCHRWEKKEDIIDQGWFPDTKMWSYGYSAAPTIEDTGDCPMRVCVYSKTVGAPPVECAVVDNMNARYTLEAQNICNGSFPWNHGKSICHTKAGLIERVKFKEPVFTADPLPVPQGGDVNQKYFIKNQCVGKFIDDLTWEYYVPENECYIIFDTVAVPHRRAKLTVIPFDLPLYSGSK